MTERDTPERAGQQWCSAERAGGYSDEWCVLPVGHKEGHHYEPKAERAGQPTRCEGRYPSPWTSPSRTEPFEVTYRCGLEAGHDGDHGPERAGQPHAYRGSADSGCRVCEGGLLDPIHWLGEPGRSPQSTVVPERAGAAEPAKCPHGCLRDGDVFGPDCDEACAERAGASRQEEPTHEHCPKCQAILLTLRCTYCEQGYPRNPSSIESGAFVHNGTPEGRVVCSMPHICAAPPAPSVEPAENDGSWDAATRKAAGTAPSGAGMTSPSTRPFVPAPPLRAIAGALKSAIDAHGPITRQLVSSAAKRILGNLLSEALPILPLPAPPVEPPRPEPVSGPCLSCAHVLPFVLYTSNATMAVGLCEACRDAASAQRGPCSPERGCLCK